MHFHLNIWNLCAYVSVSNGSERISNKQTNNWKMLSHLTSEMLDCGPSSVRVCVCVWFSTEEFDPVVNVYDNLLCLRKLLCNTRRYILHGCLRHQMKIINKREKKRSNNKSNSHTLTYLLWKGVGVCVWETHCTFPTKKVRERETDLQSPFNRYIDGHRCISDWEMVTTQTEW